MNTEHGILPATLGAVDVAALCHEANRKYCELMGDFSQPPWAEAPEWQKNSAIVGVIEAGHNPGITPEQNHENWLKIKRAEGWTYGEEKNPDLKTHPCFLPYSELPYFQKKKDELFLAIVAIFRDGIISPPENRDGGGP